MNELTRQQFVSLLRGMEKTECEAPHGWWETSEGVKFGAEIKMKLLAHDAALRERLHIAMLLNI